MTTSYSSVSNNFLRQYLKHILFKYRDVVFGCIFISIFIILLWSTTSTKHTHHVENYYLEEMQADMAGGENWEQIRKNALAALEFQVVRTRNKRLPDNYFTDPKNRAQYRTKSGNCAPYPKFTDLVFANQYWQVLETPNSGLVYILSAAYDNRPSSGPVIRLVTTINRNNFTQNVYCQFWFRNTPEAIISEAAQVKFVWLSDKLPGKNGTLVTYIISCELPVNVVPESVSLVNDKCDLSSNNVKVYDSTPPVGGKENFGVCIKAIDFYYDKNSVNIVEWIELLKILGAGKIYFYLFRANPVFDRVLQHYQHEGIIDITRMTIPGQLIPYPYFVYEHEKHMESDLLELASFHDCLFRNMHKYKYISVVDIDEVLTPVSQLTWIEMFNAINEMKDPKENYTYYCTRHTRFWNDWNLDKSLVADIPPYTPMLRHITRTDFLDKSNSPKGFYDTRYVLIIHHHWPLTCIGPGRIFYVPTNITQMNHYRLKYYRAFPGPFYIDKLIWNYKEELIENTKRSLEVIGILNN